MKIIVCCLKYEYGDPARGLSFEYYNFLDTLIKMDNGANTIIHFPFDELYKRYGRKEMNNKLVGLVKESKPDLVFFFLFNDEFEKEALLYIRDELKVTTFNWFADDHWRFFNFSRFWAPLFSFVSTTDSKALKKYHQYGIYNVIKTQWGFNHFVYNLPTGFDFNSPTNFSVTFVGQKHSNRASYVNFLQSKGIDIKCFGRGWKNGRVSFDEMLNIFRTSKINLNFSNSSGSLRLRNLATLFFTRRIDMKLRLYPFWMFYFNAQALFNRFTRRQIKGRVFEIPGSGGFLLTQNADNLSDYFLDGKEIAIFENKRDLLEKVKFYLEKEDFRKEVAYNGYLRAIREHTYEARFKDIFKKIGLTF
ncbi:MAG: CgeB family protein [Candidatus Kapaibacteriota bacterium]